MQLQQYPPPSRHDDLAEEQLRVTLRQMRLVIRVLMDGRTMEECAGLVGVATSTFSRIMHARKNLHVKTFAKIVGRLGGQVVIKVER